jgi:hypothetical protein
MLLEREIAARTATAVKEGSPPSNRMAAQHNELDVRFTIPEERIVVYLWLYGVRKRNSHNNERRFTRQMNTGD